jgi:hypothetical protein
MARSVIIKAKCDNCGVLGEEEDFEMDRAIEISRLTRKPKMIDLCTERVPGGKNCNEKFEKAMRPWLDAGHTTDTASARSVTTSSAKSPSTSRNTGPLCDDPDCVAGPRRTPFRAKSSQGLSMHKVRSHGAQPVSNNKSNHGRRPLRTA